ncbi:MAG: signal peptidase I [Coriobacteriia bacterium]|nr:signal peptidase I [Coriobacteriia bacterium]
MLVFWYNNKPNVSRVIALEGDEVNIDSRGLFVNGTRLSEPNITKETTQVKDAVQFPLIVPKGEVFVLGDNRDIAIDSRTFGCVEIEKTEGKVIGLFRHRGM